MNSPCDCHTCLAVRFVRAWATNIREAVAKAPRDEDGKASAFTDVGLAEANDVMLEDNADLLEEVADQLELDRHLPPDAVATKHTAGKPVDDVADRPACTFCGARSVMSDVCVSNTEQLVHTCRARECRNRYAQFTVETELIGGNTEGRRRLPLTITSKKRRRRRPRQQTKPV